MPRHCFSTRIIAILRFLPKSFYFFMGAHSPSKEIGNLFNKIQQITCKAIFRNYLYIFFDNMLQMLGNIDSSCNKYHDMQLSKSYKQ